MSSRRNFLLSLPSGIALPLAATVLASAPARAAGLAPVDGAFADQLAAYLAAQLDDAETAALVAPHIMDFALTWELPRVPAAGIDRIVAYGFGNRPNAASGNTSMDATNQAALPDPGPINELLADAVHQIRQIKDVKVYAQWEIARFLESKYQMTDVHSIEPLTAEDGSIVYLSTDGVASAIVDLEGGADAMGTVAVVGHRDHAKRCIQTSRRFGMNAAAVEEVALPATYDAESGQPWTRRRELYLMHDMLAQLTVLREVLIRQAYPNG